MRTLIFSLFFLCLSSLEARWLDRKAEGWAWYEDIEKNENEKEREDTRDQEQRSAKKVLEQVKADLEESFARAVLEPTHKNIENYLRMQKLWVERSQRFSTSWQQVLLENPDLDPASSSFSTSHYGRQIQKRDREQDKRLLIQSLKETYGLFLFFDGSVASQSFAKVAKRFCERHHWDIVAISVDGTSLRDFPEAVSDNGMVETLGIETFPCLFAFDPKTQEAKPLAFGMRSLEEVEGNVVLQFGRGNV